MTECTVLTAANNKLNVANGSVCLGCEQLDPTIYDNLYDSLCNTGSVKQECLCISPGRTGSDSILSKNGLYDNMPEELKASRGIWYSPCRIVNYRSTKSIRDNNTDKAIACTNLNNYLVSSGVNFDDLKARTTCYDSNGNFAPLINPRVRLIERYGLIIVIGIVILIIFILVIVFIGSKKK